MKPNVVDSSGWIEYFTDAPNADFFADPIEDTESLVVPSLVVMEVFKWMCREQDEVAALHAAALMEQGRTVVLDSELAMRAAKLGLKHNLPLADSVVFATALMHDAILWTQDKDFARVEGVKFIPKKSSR